MGSWKNQLIDSQENEVDQLRRELRETKKELHDLRGKVAQTSRPAPTSNVIVITRGVEGEPIVLAGKRKALIAYEMFGGDHNVEVFDLGNEEKLLMPLRDLITQTDVDAHLQGYYDDYEVTP